MPLDLFVYVVGWLAVWLIGAVIINKQIKSNASFLLCLLAWSGFIATVAIRIAMGGTPD